MSREIYLDAPSLSDLEKEYLSKAIDSGYVSTVGPFVPEFEEKFADFLGVKKAIATQSGTAALHMALYALGIGSGDEVIVPATTFIATANPIIYVGAKPVFVDIDKKTWNIDPQEIEKNITKKTKAIIPVHLYGNPCDMVSIMAIAKKYKLYIIEDATESLGSIYKDKQTGTFGDYGCFSFNGNKTITTGGGGMIVSDNLEGLEHIKFLINQAKDDENSLYHPEIGFNYRMTNIEAALGLAQMEKLGEFLNKKKQFNELYKKELGTIDGVGFQDEYPQAQSSYWMNCLVLKKNIDILALKEKLKEKEIPTRNIFMPLMEFPPYKKYKQSNYKNSYYIHEKGLCLPSSTLNSSDSIYYVCKNLKDLVR